MFILMLINDGCFGKQFKLLVIFCLLFGVVSGRMCRHWNIGPESHTLIKLGEQWNVMCWK